VNATRFSSWRFGDAIGVSSKEPELVISTTFWFSPAQVDALVVRQNGLDTSRSVTAWPDDNCQVPTVLRPSDQSEMKDDLGKFVASFHG